MDRKKRGLFLVAFVLLVVIFASLVQAEQSGCYIYPNAADSVYCVNNIPESKAKEDCTKNPGCSISQYFLPGKDCSTINECTLVPCKTDCQTKPLGKCQQQSSEAVPEEEYGLWCSPGCCKISNKFCQFNLLKAQCSDKATKLGVSLTDVLFDNSPGMNINTCNQNYCKVAFEKSVLQGYVLQQNGNPVADAGVSLVGLSSEQKTSTQGFYEFFPLNPGTYLVEASAIGYATKSITISLKSNQTTQQNFTLQKAEGNALFVGVVVDVEGKPLEKATITLTGPVNQQTESDAQGKFQFSTLMYGSYTITVGKIGYIAEQKALSVDKAEISQTFTLQKAAVQGIKGTVYLDTNNNQKLDNNDKPIYGAKIYVDGLFRGYSQFDKGNYELSVEISNEAQEVKIKATYQDFTSDEITVTLKKGEAKDVPLFLVSIVGECSEIGSERPVSEFVVAPIKGKKQLLLEWKKPCAEVIGYTITRSVEGKADNTFEVAGYSVNYVDDTVAWNTVYTYELTPLYATSAEIAGISSGEVSPGHEACENKYHDDTGWETFCLSGEKNIRKTVWICNENNELVGSDCAVQDGQGYDFYCARVAERVAACKNDVYCSQGGDPLGLYYNRYQCYGTEKPAEATTYCYYDTTGTVVDSCRSCSDIDTCFDYTSKDACEVNNCFTKECQWVAGAANTAVIDYDIILPSVVVAETGAGYCVEKKYNTDDKCFLCSPSATLFENYYCTAEVCAGLGRCFSENKLRECVPCGAAPTTEKNCYSYRTELECTQGSPVHKDVFGTITHSKDQCNWGKCFWKGISNGKGSCIKDGNGNGEDDCSPFSGIEAQLCRMDVSSPKTTLLSQKPFVLSLAHPTLQFKGDDHYHTQSQQRSPLGTLTYCLLEADANAQAVCSEKDYVTVSYPGKIDEEAVIVDLLGSNFLQQKAVSGKAYRLLYSSADKYSNQEDIRETAVFVDTVAPVFTINEKITTEQDLSTLTVFLEGTEEPISCRFSLEPILPLGQKQDAVLGRDVKQKEVTFSSLHGVKFNLNVTCTDDYDNVNSVIKRYTFDLEQDIDLVYPTFQEIIAATEISFKIHTDVGASCSLYTTATNEKIVDFKILAEEGKEHITTVIPGFVEKEYAGEHKVVCQDLLTNKEMTDYFHFTIDFTPPSVEAVLREGKREVIVKDYSWEEYFVQQAVVDFNCIAEGFPCVGVFYCLGDGCELLSSPKYQEYTTSVIVNASTQLCYYAKDTASSMIYQPLCGTINVAGYGITLLQPQRYYYQNEQWGASSTLPFAVEFMTKVPTLECRLDFVNNFVYQDLPSHKVLPPSTPDTYKIAAFPDNLLTTYMESGETKSVYVQCKNLAGELGPIQKINFEYDPTAPTINSANASPNPIYEGITTQLSVATNDKTLCKYSDHSFGSGSVEYETMEYSFPGADKNLLGLVHKDLFSLTGVSKDGQQHYLLITKCKNAAGNVSEAKEITFDVDYSTAGFIVAGSVKPENHVMTKDVVISLQTSKKAFCDYNINGTYYQFMVGQGTLDHSTPLNNLPEGKYSLPLRCTMGDHVAYGAVNFIIDFIPPTIKEIDDGNYTCGSKELHAFIYTSEENNSLYQYEIYDLGLEKGFSAKSNNSNSSAKSYVYTSNASKSSSKGQLALSGTVPVTQPLAIATTTLEEGHRYNFRVRASDAAGNWGEFKESDGVVLTAENYSVCTSDKDAPSLQIATNSTCTSTTVELLCKDLVGCAGITIGHHPTSTFCNATTSYTGQKITLKKSEFVCYQGEDFKGQLVQSSALISFADKDADGVADSCDTCFNTGAGKIVDVNGCADGQANQSLAQKKDTDNDGLPDYWEKLYSREDCPLDYVSADSNGNGEKDLDEDYDHDGFTVYDEFLSGSDPCAFDVKPSTPLEKEEKKPSQKDLERTLPVFEQATNVVVWVLFILGLFLFFGGTGYLLYYYKSYKSLPTMGKGFGSTSLKSISSTSKAVGKSSGIESAFLRLRKAEAEKRKARQRAAAFSEFSKESAIIPHIEPLLKSTGAHVPKVQTLAEKYLEHKDEIKPGLTREEKSIFGRLENIAASVKNKKIQDVVTKDEAKDIFTQLKELAQKRKEKQK